jgi:hypothetical protein
MSIIKLLKPYTSDAVEHFAGLKLNPVKIDESGEEVALSPGEMQDRLNDVSRWLSLIPGEMMRSQYEDLIFRRHKAVILKKSNLTKAVAAKIEAGNSAKSREVIEGGDKLKARLPEGIDVYEVLRDGGWYQVENGIDGTGIFFIENMDRDPKQVSNFTIEPLFHKVDRDDNTRIVRINDGVTGTIIVEMPSSALLSRDSFRKFLLERGAYFFDGSAMELDKITKKIMRQFPKAWELKELGYQPEGFFAYFNYVFNGQLKPYNEAGLIEHDNRHYYSPAVSRVNEDERQGNDIFKNDRFLEYVPPPITFGDWARMVKDAYGDQAISIVYSVILALHRDIHFKIDNNCPHIYFFGDTGSGKSKAAESIAALFFKDIPAFALSSGTDHAMALRFGRYRNCPVLFNEFDIDMIDLSRFNILKTAFDGEGKESGTKQRGKSITYPVESLVVIIGQYLNTMDDGSILNRSILEKFFKVKVRSKKQVAAYEALKKLEKKGLGGVITELMPLRPAIEGSYYEEFHRIMHGIVKDLREEGVYPEDRVVRNYSAIATMAKLFEAHIDLPWKSAEIRKWCKDKIESLCDMLSKSDILSTFWEVLEGLHSDGLLRNGKHFKTDRVSKVRVTVDGKDTDMSVSEDGAARDILWIRLGPAHQLYLKACRSTGNKAIDKVSLQSYLKEKDYFLGRVDSERFTESMKTTDSGFRKKNIVTTSAYLIDMAKAKLTNTGLAAAEVEYEDPTDKVREDHQAKDDKASAENDKGPDDLPF